MKYFIFAFVCLVIVSCNESSKSSIKYNDDQPLSTIKLDDSITYSIIEKTAMFSLISISGRSDTAHMRRAMGRLSINTDVVYFKFTNENSGKDYASFINGDFIILDPPITNLYINDKIKDVREYKFNSNNYSSQTLLYELEQFNNNLVFLNKMKALNDKSLDQSISLYKSEICNLQKRLFPSLRSCYTKIAKTTLWEDDIDVSSNGSTISFSGGIFITNKNKQEFYEGIQTILYKFRFKQVNFRWYKGSDEYTYYKIESPKDSELEIIPE